MPRRWLSVRDRKGNADATRKIGEPQVQQDFDFAFATELDPSANDRHCELVSSTPRRPTTAGGEGSKSRRRPDLTLLIERPRSSDSPVSGTPLSAIRYDGTQIGVAVGSPRHTPPKFADALEDMKLEKRQETFLLQGPLSSSNQKSKKWKIGAIFKARAHQSKEPVFYRVQPLGTVQEQKLGLPISRKPWRNPRSPLITQECLDDHDPMPTETDLPKSTTPSGKDGVLSPTSEGDVPTPSLEVSIPRTPLERYSIMFKDINGVKQSGLLIRRSKDLDQLLLVTTDKFTSKMLPVPQLERRATSPTVHRNGEQAQSKSHPTYSLFPTTPTGLKPQSNTESPNTIRNRSTTCPTPVSPACPQNETSLSKTNDTAQPSKATYHRGTQSTDSFLPSPPVFSEASTRESTQSEIFFDIKSYRDSRGQGGQFEMTRPPSAAVQSARLKSNMRKLQQAQPKVENPSTQRIAIRTEKTTSVIIDETIAIVETLTSISSKPSDVKTDSTSRGSNETSRDSHRSEGESVVLAMDTEIPARRKVRKQSGSRSRYDGLNIDVPSPVIEQAEEVTPRSRNNFSPNKPKAETGMKIDITESPVSACTQSTTPLKRTPSPPPPQPPVKDSKYIPLSKYAPKKTTEDLVRQTGLRPVRPYRSNTDNMVSYNTRSSSLRRPQYPERSTTLPAPAAAQVPQPKKMLPTPTPAGPVHPKGEGPAMVAYVKPAAEVSVARTVSLSRSPSARVIGSKFPKRSDSHRERPVEEVKEKKVPLGMPKVQEVHARHKPGQSLHLVLDTATIAPSSPPPPMPSPKEYWQRPTEPPQPSPTMGTASQ